MPVVTQLIFQNCQWMIDLNRLEIKETNIEDIYKTGAINSFKAYYSKLPFTPLRAVGINIHCNLQFEDDTELNSIDGRIRDPNSYLKFFETDKVEIRSSPEIIWDLILW